MTEFNGKEVANQEDERMLVDAGGKVVRPDKKPSAVDSVLWSWDCGPFQVAIYGNLSGRQSWLEVR
jgi:hypothetical protein